MNLGTVMLARIYISDRHRKDLGDLDSLGESLDDIGQIQTIAVKEIHSEDTHLFEDGFEYELLAGGRRLFAMKNKFGPGHLVNVTIFPEDLTKTEKLAIKLC